MITQCVIVHLFIYQQTCQWNNWVVSLSTNKIIIKSCHTGPHASAFRGSYTASSDHNSTTALPMWSTLPFKRFPGSGDPGKDLAVVFGAVWEENTRPQWIMTERLFSCVVCALGTGVAKAKGNLSFLGLCCYYHPSNQDIPHNNNGCWQRHHHHNNHINNKSTPQFEWDNGGWASSKNLIVGPWSSVADQYRASALNAPSWHKSPAAPRSAPRLCAPEQCMTQYINQLINVLFKKNNCMYV